MPIRAVIFDLGGVIIRTEDGSGRRKWEKRLGLPEGALPQLVFGCEASAQATVGKLTDADVWKYVASTFGLDAEQLREFQRDFWSGDRIDAALVQFLRDLRPRYKTAILSNAWSDTRHALTQIRGLGDAVDTIIISAEEGIAKPDARIYRLAVERLGVQLEEALFVDDFEVNVQAARAVGMRSVHFQNTAQAIAELNQYLDEQE